MSVFISYNSADSYYAFRIYYDLVRSGIKVYLYEKVEELGVNFEKEIYDAINQSSHFCLLDSSNSRNAEWVKKECKHASKLKERGKDIEIIPCIIQEIGNWFYNNEHLEKQSHMRGVVFPPLTNHLDNNESYRSAIVKLCKSIGIEYIPWSEIPHKRDFEKELATLKITDETRLFFSNSYENLLFVNKANLKTQLIRAKAIHEECKYYQLRILALELALGDLLFNERKTEVALDVLNASISHFSDDIRPLYLVSLIYFQQRDYVRSLEYVEKALKIIKRSSNDSYLKTHQIEFLFNKLEILIALEKYEPAWNLLDSIQENKDRPEYLIAKVKLSLFSNKFWLLDYEKLKRCYYHFESNPKRLNMQIADLEFYLGRKCIGEESLKHYRQARLLNFDCVNYHAEYFQVMFCLNQLKDSELKDSLIYLQPKSKEEHYYYGLILFLNNAQKEAIRYFKESSQLGWPFYDDLI